MYCQLFRQVEDLAHGLLDSGIRPGDRVVVSMPVHADFVALMFACFRVGAVFCPLPAVLSSALATSVISKLNPRLFVYELMPDSEEAILQAVPGLQASQCIQLIHNEAEAILPGSLSWHQWLAPVRLARLRLQHHLSGKFRKADHALHASSPALICLSGPANAQAVVLCYENILAQRSWLDRETRLSRHDKVLVNGAGMDMHTLIHSLIAPLTLGASAVLMQRFDAEAAMQALPAHCISMLIQPAANYRAMLNTQAFRAYSIHSLRWAILTNRPPVAAWMERLQKFAPQVGAGWSLPEAGGFVAFAHCGLRPDEMTLATGFVLGDHSLLSIRATRELGGAAGLPLPDGHIGEVCLHPPHVFSGYMGDSEATRERISREGILYIGMQGYVRAAEAGKMLFLLDTKSKQLQQMRKRWLDQGMLHPAMSPTGTVWQPLQA